MSKASVLTNQLPAKRQAAPASTASSSVNGVVPPGTSVIDALFFDGDQQQEAQKRKKLADWSAIEHLF
jgi:hypothetical protein